jgi:glycosyltransferase involved in cell wall biosynthesis
MADEYLSFPAVAAAPRPVVTFHYATALDRIALKRPWSPALLQDRRAERSAARRSSLVLAYSDRVAAATAPHAVVVPIACPIPTDAVRPVDDPVAALIADWRWPPNGWALDRLLRSWPEVRRRVQSARLLLAGRGLPAVGSIAGVEPLGVVAAARDVLERASVLAFPCPDTSGPKMKVLEALAHGLPVVTTTSGLEGIDPAGRAGALAVPMAAFAERLAALLTDPELRGQLSRAGRPALASTHGPLAAACARARACAPVARGASGM